MKFSFASIVGRRPFEGSRAGACAATIGVPIIGTMSTSIASSSGKKIARKWCTFYGDR